MGSEETQFLLRGFRVLDFAWEMLGDRRLLGEEDMLLSSRLRTISTNTLNFGDGRGFCDREDDCRGDLCLTTTSLSSIMSMSSIT